MLKSFRRRFMQNELAVTLRAKADRLRDSAHWRDAAQLYKLYLELRPEDAALWVQLGHCQKESGLIEDADVSYARAATLAPSGADIWLQIGHLRKIQGRVAEAIANYAKALDKDPMLTAARFELEALGAASSNVVASYADRIGEIRAELDRLRGCVVSQSGQIDSFLKLSNSVGRLLELVSTVKALGFAVKRQEDRAAEARGRFEALEGRLHRLEVLLTDGEARGNRSARASLAVTDERVKGTTPRRRAT
jgi:tetratricopeptide (TPR) repeat protein